MQYIVNGEENPFPAIGDAAYRKHAEEEDRAMDIGNMHKRLVKIARMVPEISYRTDRRTHHNTFLSLSIVFSERELTFTHVRYMLSPVRLSVVCL